MDLTLSYKIRALIEGLSDVAKLGATFLQTAKDAEALKNVQASVQGVGTTAQAAKKDIDQAFTALGGRSTAQIKAEIDKITQALEQVKSGGASFDEVGRASDLAKARISQLNAELSAPAPRTFGERMAEIGQKINSADFKGALSDVNNLTSGLGGMAGIATRVVTAYLAFKAITVFRDLVADAIAFGIEAAKLAARVETLGVTLNAVGRNAGYSTAGLAQAEAQVKKMGITTEATRDSLIKMIQAGIGINDLTKTTVTGVDGVVTRLTKAQELSRAAQDLAVVSGENSSATLQRLITNIQQMDIVGLRFMGLTVNRNAAEAQFATALGKTAGALTETERKQAFYNATMTEAKKLQGVYADALETVGKKQASLARYQAEFSLSVGNILVPAYGALVDAQTEFNKGAQVAAERFSKTSSTALTFKSAVSEAAGAVSGLLVEGVKQGLEIFGAFSRALKGASDLASPLIQALVVIGKTVDDLGSKVGIDNLLAKLNPITAVLNGIAVILAVVKDAVVVTFGVAVTAVASFSVVIGNVIEGLGKAASLIGLDLGRGLADFGSELAKSGKSVTDWTTGLVAGVFKGDGAVGELGKTFGTVANSSEKAKAAAAVFSKQIEDLSQRQRDGTISGGELEQKYQDISKAFKLAADKGEITGKSFVELTRQAAAVPGTLAQAYTEASEKAQVALGQLRTGISNDTGVAVAYMEALLKSAVAKNTDLMGQMGTSAVQIGADIVNVYEKFAKSAASIQDLVQVNSRLIEARKLGLISEKEYQGALETTNVAFDKLFATQLKAAETKNDFDRLKNVVFDLGEQGLISGEKIQTSLQSIADKAAGASKNMKELVAAQQALSADDQYVKIAQAHLEVTRAEVALMKSRVGVVVAQVALSREDSELNRLKLRIAEDEQVVAKASLELARLQYGEEVQSLDVILLKNKQITAEKRLQQDVTNESLQKQVRLAEEAAQQAEVLNLKLKSQVDVQREAVFKAEEALVLDKGRLEVFNLLEQTNRSSTQAMGQYTESVGRASEGTQGLSGETGKWGESVRSVVRGMGGFGPLQSKVVDDFVAMREATKDWGTAVREDGREVIGTLGEVNTVQGTIIGGYDDMIGASARWSAAVQQDYAKVSSALKALDQARRVYMEGQTGLNYGSSNTGVSGFSSGKSGVSVANTNFSPFSSGSSANPTGKDGKFNSGSGDGTVIQTGQLSPPTADGGWVLSTSQVNRATGQSGQQAQIPGYYWQRTPEAYAKDQQANLGSSQSRADDIRGAYLATGTPIPSGGIPTLGVPRAVTDYLNQPKTPSDLGVGAVGSAAVAQSIAGPQTTTPNTSASSTGSRYEVVLKDQAGKSVTLTGNTSEEAALKAILASLRLAGLASQ